MPLDAEYDDIVKKVKIGKASSEAQIFLASWIQKRCENAWKKFLQCPPELSAMLAVQAEGRVIEEWQRDIFLAQKSSDAARKKFVEKYRTPEKK